jgi:hypothetical protein
MTDRILGLPITALGIYYCGNHNNLPFLTTTAIVRFFFSTIIVFEVLLFGTLPDGALVLAFCDCLTAFISWKAVFADPQFEKHNLLG